MGRKKMYETEEQKKEANRIKSKRYYEKNKESINTLAREKYQKEKTKKSDN